MANSNKRLLPTAYSLLPKKKGFTLIEMLVTITITMLMLGGGIAAYINFNEKQTLITASKDLQAYLRSAQSKARSGDRPNTCDSLDAYQVYMAAGNNEIILRAICDGGIVQDSFDSYFLPNGVTSQDEIDMRFKVLHGGVEGAGDIVLVMDDKEYLFSVSSTGEINQGGLVE